MSKKSTVETAFLPRRRKLPANDGPGQAPGRAASAAGKRPEPVLILASASPARAQLLSACGHVFIQRPAGAPEPRRRGGRGVRAHVLGLARRKAEAAAELHPEAFVLGADTVAHIGGRILGKAGHAAGALETLSRLAGRTHCVCTAVCVIAPPRRGRKRRVLSGIDEASVTLRRLSRAELRAYVRALKPFNCAGAYALQGGGAAIIRRLRGDPSTVVGLPVELAERLLRRAGYRG